MSDIGYMDWYVSGDVQSLDAIECTMRDWASDIFGCGYDDTEVVEDGTFAPDEYGIRLYSVRASIWDGCEDGARKGAEEYDGRYHVTHDEKDRPVPVYMSTRVYEDEDDEDDCSDPVWRW